MKNGIYRKDTTSDTLIDAWHWASAACCYFLFLSHPLQKKDNSVLCYLSLLWGPALYQQSSESSASLLSKWCSTEWEIPLNIAGNRRAWLSQRKSCSTSHIHRANDDRDHNNFAPLVRVPDFFSQENKRSAVITVLCRCISWGSVFYRLR